MRPSQVSRGGATVLTFLTKNETPLAVLPGVKYAYISTIWVKNVNGSTNRSYKIGHFSRFGY